MEVERLFERFAAEYRREGTADPRPYLTQASVADRRELRALIDAFLERAPRPPWDPAAFSGSSAERALARAEERRARGAAPGGDPAWPELLPELRTRARLTRRAVVARLAAALGYPDEQERVAAYYHRMERGELPAAGVSDRVLEALAGIVGAGAAELRRAGERGAAAAGAGGEVFARRGQPEQEVSAIEALLADPGEGDRPPDQLDRLFTGGEADVR